MYNHPKFNEQGCMKWFPGNTIVSDLSKHKDVMYIIKEIQKAYQKLSFSNKYVFLPDDSIHMTVFELLCHFNRKTSQWSDNLSLDEPLEHIDLYFHEQLKTTPFPSGFKMKPLPKIETTVLKVNPFDQRATSILKEFRDQLAQKTGVRFPNHDTYQFHISFGYKIHELTQAEQASVNQLNHLLAKEISKLDTIDIEQIYYTVFEDMSEFVPYHAQARNQLRRKKGYNRIKQGGSMVDRTCKHSVP